MYISLKATVTIMLICAFALGSLCMWVFCHGEELSYDAYYEAEEVIIPEEEEP